MKKIMRLLVPITLLFAAAVYAQDSAGMMDQYKQMSEGTSANFPKELEKLLPKDFTLKNKGFVYKETANMFLFIALSGTRKNDVNVKFGHEADIEISIMAYNPQLAPHMAAQYPIVIQESKKGYSKEVANTGSAGWEYGPVIVSKVNKADVYIQKGTRKNVEIDDLKHEDQVYYFAKVVAVNKNALLNIHIIHHPKKQNFDTAIQDITKLFLETDFNKYMK